MKNLRKQLILICVSFLVNGIMVVLTSSLLTYFRSDLKLSYEQAGYLVSIEAAGNLIAGLLSGLLIRKIGRQKACMTFCLMFAAGFSVLLYARSIYLIYPLIFLCGLGWGLCNNVCHLLVNQEGMKNGSVYVLHTSYAVGAFVAPMILILCNRLQLGWRSTVWTVVVLSLVLFVCFLTTAIDAHAIDIDVQKSDRTPSAVPEVEKNQISSESGRDAADALMHAGKQALPFWKNPRFYMCFGLYFCYGGAETSINSWLITFLKEREIMGEEMAETMLSVLWLVIIFGRLLAILLAKKFSPKQLLVAQSSMMMLVILGLTFNTSTAIAVIIVVLIGAFMAGMTPANAGNAREFMTGDGLSSGIIFAGNGLGAVALPTIVGSLFGKLGLIEGMLAIVVLMALFTGLTVVNAILANRSAV